MAIRTNEKSTATTTKVVSNLVGYTPTIDHKGEAVDKAYRVGAALSNDTMIVDIDQMLCLCTRLQAEGRTSFVLNSFSADKAK